MGNYDQKAFTTGKLNMGQKTLGIISTETMKKPGEEKGFFG